MFEVGNASALRDGPKRKGFVVSPQIIIAVMGVTGAGKSFFIRQLIANDEVKVGEVGEGSRLSKTIHGPI
jgi:predicted GTPase